MYASELLSRIRCDLDTIPEYIARIERERQAVREDPPGTFTLLGDYNYATYTEIRGRCAVDPDFAIDPGAVKECEDVLDRYLERYAPGNENLKHYVTALSLYLAFIEQRPLHPPGVPFSDDIRIVKRGDGYYCTGKRRYRDDPAALCRFCICKPVSR
ncbi:DUF2115 family protein [Methanoregula sp.]|uniref:DUF2115 family protein n=1 Tax=Methanoregula sp. TaxID=2052170 RepID=UPI002CDA8E96|nr:DUF2115 family protein [Methanoregula sp.]HVP96266.1 DUF2115 family protein [Methanoregula sp.]